MTIIVVFVSVMFTFSACRETVPPKRSRSVSAIVRQAEYCGEISLDGIWQFQPAIGSASEKPDGDWGKITVPGSWKQSGWPVAKNMVAEIGKGETWGDYRIEKVGKRGSAIDRAWYRRKIEIPADWVGRSILINFDRVSTDAVVKVNGKDCGKITWPDGEVDITDAVTPGVQAILEVLVMAFNEAEGFVEYMESADAQATMKKANLPAKGLIGTVTLKSQPKGARIEDILIISKVTDKKLNLRIDLKDVKNTDSLKVYGMIKDVDGETVMEFADIKTAVGQQIELSMPCPELQLWEPGSPQLYQLELVIAGNGIKDVTKQRFGFREFEIRGRDFFLNGKPIRLRPIVWEAGLEDREKVAERISKLRQMGFNFVELWPDFIERRGIPYNGRLWLEEADRQGMLLSGIAIAMNDFIARDTSVWKTPDGKAAYGVLMERHLRKEWNHPSIVMWGTTPNFFGHDHDQNPRVIGRTGQNSDPLWQQRAAYCREGIQMIKALDPTRPVFIHNGGDVGDIHTVNCYLNMIPLQEREEWLSDYAANGDLPLLPVELGQPMNLSMNRGRNTHGNADKSESFMTEYAAIYLGPDVYSLEPKKYRDQMKTGYRGGQTYKFRSVEMEGCAPFDRVQELFNRNTWRSWRTWGITGGMIPWAFRDETLGGKTISENNQPSLAWIAGPPGILLTKDIISIPEKRLSNRLF